MAERTVYIGPLRLDASVAKRLDAEARKNERDMLQHARWLIRQALALDTMPSQLPEPLPEPIPTPELSEPATNQ